MEFQRGIKFQSLVEFRDYLPLQERILTDVLRDLIVHSLPRSCREKLTYNVPFFYGKRRICLVWPASVPWGGFNEGVMLGFCQGPLLTDPDRYLVHGRNKRVYYRIYKDAGDIDQAKVTGLLHEAARVDRSFR